MGLDAQLEHLPARSSCRRRDDPILPLLPFIEAWTTGDKREHAPAGADPETPRPAPCR